MVAITKSMETNIERSENDAAFRMIKEGRKILDKLFSRKALIDTVPDSPQRFNSQNQDISDALDTLLSTKDIITFTTELAKIYPDMPTVTRGYVYRALLSLKT